MAWVSLIEVLIDQSTLETLKVAARIIAASLTALYRTKVIVIRISEIGCDVCVITK